MQASGLRMSTPRSAPAARLRRPAAAPRAAMVSGLPRPSPAPRTRRVAFEVPRGEDDPRRRGHPRRARFRLPRLAPARAPRLPCAPSHGCLGRGAAPSMRAARRELGGLSVFRCEWSPPRSTLPPRQR
eukprot:353149-Chlamydomonas_euryale.AAC.9